MDIIKPICTGFFYNDNNVLGDLMKNFKYFAQSYVDWVIRLGRLRFSLLGVMILAVLALCTQILFSLFIVHQISWVDIFSFGNFWLTHCAFCYLFFSLY